MGAFSTVHAREAQVETWHAGAVAQSPLLTHPTHEPWPSQTPLGHFVSAGLEAATQLPFLHATSMHARGLQSLAVWHSAPLPPAEPLPPPRPPTPTPTPLPPPT